MLTIIAVGCSSGEPLLEDENLQKLVSNKLDKNPDDITKEDLKQIINLKITGQEGAEVGAIKSVAGLENLSKLKALNLKSNQIKNVEPLKNLTELRYLDLSNNNIEDLKPLTNLDTLIHLNVSNNDLDISSGSKTMKIIKELRAEGIKVKY